MDGGTIFWMVVGGISLCIMILAGIYNLRHPEESKKSLDEMKKRVEEQRHPTCNGEVHCPKCNSTQIQLVTRKWSPMTGFFTNKVDRVCMNCKSKF